MSINEGMTYKTWYTPMYLFYMCLKNTNLHNTSLSKYVYMIEHYKYLYREIAV